MKSLRKGDRVRNIYTGETGTILRIGKWSDDFNPYKVQVIVDGRETPYNIRNFKKSHLTMTGKDDKNAITTKRSGTSRKI